MRGVIRVVVGDGHDDDVDVGDAEFGGDVVVGCDIGVVDGVVVGVVVVVVVVVGVVSVSCVMVSLMG